MQPKAPKGWPALVSTIFGTAKGRIFQNGTVQQMAGSALWAGNTRPGQGAGELRLMANLQFTQTRPQLSRLPPQSKRGTPSTLQPWPGKNRVTKATFKGRCKAAGLTDFE